MTTIDFASAGLFEVLHYRGIFDLRGLYKFMADWLQKKGFEFHEKVYKHKQAELEFTWEARRKVDAYVQHVITIVMHLYGDAPGDSTVEEVEVIKNGVKKKMMKARMTLTFSGKVVTDYPDDFGSTRWNKSPFLKTLQNVFEKSVIKQDLDFKHEDVLYYHILHLYEAVKKHLEMEGSGSVY